MLTCTGNYALEDRMFQNCVEFCCKPNRDWDSWNYMYLTVLIILLLSVSEECSQELHVVSGSFSLPLDNYWQDFVKVPNILFTLFCIHSHPKIFLSH